MLGFGRRRLFSALLQVQKRPCQPSRNMRLVQFQAPHLEEPHLGLESGVGGGVVDLNAFDSTLPKTMVQFLEQGETTLSVARRALATQLPVIPRSQVTFLAPVTRPDKVICVGLNYADHCQEQNVRVPKSPIIFSKFSSSIVGPYDEIILPPESKEVDWEVEMAVVIGKKGKHIKVRWKGVPDQGGAAVLDPASASPDHTPHTGTVLHWNTLGFHIPPLATLGANV